MNSIDLLIRKLNWFYSLEISQVKLYTAQSKAINDLQLKRTLERVAAIEQGHVDNIANTIKDLGGTPTHLGDVLAPIVGTTLGTVAEKTGLMNMLKLNITLENKAIEDYHAMIKEVQERQDLTDLLWSNLIDEDLHTSWFTLKIQELVDIKD